ncbi:MAG TPA: hypothetical protein VIS26_05310 [Candidatus Limnocylindria bacterium]
MATRTRKERQLSVRRIAAFVLLCVLAGCACSADPLPGYRSASSEEHAALVRAVSEYYALRARVFVSGDAAALFAAYPKLQHGEDLREGINLDGFWVPHMRELDVVDVSDDLEGYEAARFYVKETAAVAFVHGWETWNYPRGDHTGLEFFTRIDLAIDAGGWVVERTDEQMMGERAPRTP